MGPQSNCASAPLCPKLPLTSRMTKIVTLALAARHAKGGSVMKLSVTWTAAAVAVAGMSVPAFAVKDGGTLRMIHRDNAPSGSIHEEATNSVTEPFMGVFNN